VRSRWLQRLPAAAAEGEVSACVPLLACGCLGRRGSGWSVTTSACCACRSGSSRRRRREGRAFRGALEGLRGAALQRPAARGEGLLLPAGAHRAGEGLPNSEGSVHLSLGWCCCWLSVPSRFAECFCCARAGARVGALAEFRGGLWRDRGELRGLEGFWARGIA